MKHRSSRRAAVLAMLVAVGLLAAGCGSSRAGAGSSPGAPLPVGVAQRYPIGQRVASGSVNGTLLDGAAFDLASLRGEVVVVNFWGSWCAPCRAEFHDLSDTFLATKGLRVAFVGADVRDDHDAAVAFVADFQVPYPSIFDPPGRVALAFTQVNPSVVPTTVILDRSGKVAAVFREPITRGQLEPVVRAVAAETVLP